jgi:hypothetical protein
MILERIALPYKLPDREVWAIKFDSGPLLVVCDDDLRGNIKLMGAARGAIRYNEEEEQEVIAGLRAAGCWDLLDHPDFEDPA